jgi:DNA-binding transcriptional MerR regulator
LSGNDWLVEPLYSFTPQRFPLLIQDAIEGKLTAAWFCHPFTSVFSLDNDFKDPRSPAWTNRGRTPSPALRDALSTLIDLFGLPSLLSHTPHGFHSYYVLNTPTKFSRIKQAIAPFLHSLPFKCELLPSPRQALRIPRKTWILHPFTLQRIFTKSDCLDFSTLPRHSFESLLDKLPKPSRHAKSPRVAIPSTKSLAVSAPAPVLIPSLSHNEAVQNLRARTKKDGNKSTPPTTATRRRTHSRLPDISLLLPDSFVDGHTNDQLLSIIRNCKSAGFSLSKIKKAIHDLLRSSTAYHGPLGNSLYSLNHRIEHLFDTCNSSAGFHTSEIPDFLVDAILEKLRPYNLHYEDASLKSFIRNLLDWYFTHKNATQGTPAFIFFCSMNKDYAALHRDGFFPLPSTCIRTWIHNYRPILDALLHCRILEIHSSGHSRNDHRSRRLRLHLPATRKTIALPSTSIREITLRSEPRSYADLRLAFFSSRSGGCVHSLRNFQSAKQSYNGDSALNSLIGVHSQCTHCATGARFVAVLRRGAALRIGRDHSPTSVGNHQVSRISVRGPP